MARYPKTPLLTKERRHPDGLYRDDGVVLTLHLSPVTHHALTQMSIDKDRLQAQTDRNERHQRLPPLRRRYDLARRKMESDLDMKTSCEMSAKRRIA